MTIPDHRDRQTAITREEYHRLMETATRPLTDGPIGADPTRRDMDAQASAAVTEVLGVIPQFDTDPEDTDTPEEATA